MWTGLLPVLPLVVVFGLAHGCQKSDIEIKLNGAACTTQSCLGKCTPDGECCLEKCFDKIPMNDQRIEHCAGANMTDDCKSYENLTSCIAEKLNKSFEVCWRHTMYYLNNQASNTKNFSPVICPCEWTTSRKLVGKCLLGQCTNSSVCEEKRDTILNQDVCCINKSILPTEEDCNGTKFQEPVNKYLNVSKYIDCLEVCDNGFCAFPDKSRIPACCRRPPTQEKRESTSDELHGGVIAVIVIVVIVLIVVGVLVALYTYRLKQDDNMRILQEKDKNKHIELTGVEELMENQNLDNEQKYGLSWNGHAAEQNGYTQIENKYTRSMTPDFTAQPLAQNFMARTHSIDELRNRTAEHGATNEGFRDNESYDEEQSYETYRRRMHSLARENDEKIRYEFDDGLGHSSGEETKHA